MEQNQQEEADKQAERFESIPWASLVPDKSPEVRRYLTVGATIVVGIVVGVVGGGILRGDGGRSVVVTVPDAATPAQTQIPVPAQSQGSFEPSSQPSVPPEAMPPAAANVPTPPRLYSEADLMAVMPEEEMRAAAMRAEWFVTDFFTVDGEVSAASDVLAALPSRQEDVPLPHTDGGGVSYVEWARAFLVEPLGPARYRVEVAFRSLAGPGFDQLVRGPVRAIAVEVHVGADGATSVADFPAPVAAPPDLALEAEVIADSEAPPEILAAALTTAAEMGDDATVLATGLGDAGWRVVVLVTDESGLRWPLVVRL